MIIRWRHVIGLLVLVITSAFYYKSFVMMGIFGL